MPRKAAFWALLAVLGALRFAHWGASFTGDEAFTVRGYASKPASEIVRRYDSPNNHVLLSLILRGLDSAGPRALIGSMADHRLLQLPSLIASVGALALLYLLVLELTGASALALLAMTALGLSHWHLAYAHMLRGYSLSAFFVLGAALTAARAARRGPGPSLLLLPLFLAAAHYTVPSNAYFTLAAGGWALVAARGRARAWIAGSFAAGGALTLLLYRPVLGQLRAVMAGVRAEAASQAWGAGRQLGECVSVLGAGRTTQAAVLVLAALGAAYAARRRRGIGSLALLGAGLALVPPAIVALQGTIAPARTFVPGLAGWAILAALGLRGAMVWARAGRRGRPGWAWAAAALALVSIPDVRAFVERNRGLDVRGAMALASRLTRDGDDFAVVFTQRGTFFDELNWDYYGFASGIEPYHHLVPDRDYAYMSRRRYVLLAADEPAARRAAIESGVDDAMLALTPAGRAGRIGAWVAEITPQALERWRAESAGRDVRRRAAALHWLGFDALTHGRISDAAGLLDRARAADPSDARVRWLRARAAYLGFDDARAVEGLEWVVAHDTTNVHAPLYLAEVLADVGRTAEASRLYEWYGRPTPPGAWFLKTRAASGLKAIREGKGTAKLVGTPDPDSWTALARACYYKGAVERAAIAMTMSLKGDPVLERWLKVAELRAANHEWHVAIALASRAYAETKDPRARALLARYLIRHREYERAETVLAESLGTEDAEAEKLRAYLARFRDA